MSKSHKLYFLSVLTLLLISCSENSKQSKPDIQTNKVIKECKMYSSDFVILNPDDKGHLIQMFKFNKKGYVNELIRYDLDGNIIGKFDIYGQNTPFPLPSGPQYVDTVLIIKSFNESNKLISKEIKKYNSKGLLTEVAFFNSSDSLIKRNTYKYDNEGHIIEDVYWDIELNQPKQKILYEYEFY